jgi:hypothetical protein
VLEDVLLQIAQPLSGLDAELLHEPGASGLEGRQCVGLPPAAIERQHLQLHQALLEGMRDDQRVQLPQQLAVAAKLKIELDPLDDRSQALLLELRPLGGKQTVRAHSPERLSAPETERLVDPLPSDSRLTVRARPMRLAERLLPAVDIALARLHIQSVAVRLIDEPAAVTASLAQRLAQARDMHLQAVTRSRGRVLAPQLVDQPLSGHDATAHQRQDRKQRAGPLTSQPYRPATRPRLDRTEQLDLQPTAGAVGHPRDHRVSYDLRAPTLRPTDGRLLARRWRFVGALVKPAAMYHHNNLALARALAPEAPRSRPSTHSIHGRFTMKTRRRIRAVLLSLAVIATLVPASALALPGQDAAVSSVTSNVGDTPATFPGASRAPEYEAPATLQVVRPERTIVRDVDQELPIILAGVALAVALGGAGYVLVRTRTLQRRLTH